MKEGQLPHPDESGYDTFDGYRELQKLLGLRERRHVSKNEARDASSLSAEEILSFLKGKSPNISDAGGSGSSKVDSLPRTVVTDESSAD